MANNLERELVQAKKGLSGLMKDTAGAIGDVARIGSSRLDELPAAKNHPFDVLSQGQLSVDRRFFKGRRIVRATEQPTEQESVAMVDRNVAITETATEAYRRQHRFRNGDILRLPIQERLVAVEYRLPEEGRNPRERGNPTVDISTNGYARWRGRTDYTYPDPVRRDELSSSFHGYPNGDALQRRFAATLTNGLVVAEFIADSLSRTHGIEIDVKALQDLQEAWQHVAPRQTEMEENIAVLLPRKDQ